MTKPQKQPSDTAQVERPLAYLPLEDRDFLLSILLDTISDHIYFKDLDSRFVLVNRSMATLFHLSSPEFAVGKSDADFFSVEHSRAALEDEREMLRTGKPIENLVERETWPDGSESWVSTTKMPIRDESGRVIGSFGISRNITDQMVAQNALQESRDQVGSILASITDGFIALNADLLMTYANPAAEKFLKTASAKLKGHRIEDIFSGDTGASLSETFEAALRDSDVCECEVFDEGDQRWLMFRSYPAEEGLSVYFRDVTHRKALQQRIEDQQRELEALVRERTQELTDANTNLTHEISERERAEAALVQSERLEAISSMASGMAVNFESIVQLISKYASSIIDSTLPGMQAHEEGKRILEAARRGGDLTGRLMGVALADTHVKTAKAVTFELEPAIVATGRLMSDLLNQKSINIQVDRFKESFFVSGEPNQIKDVLMAVFMNAAESMPEQGGAIRVDVLAKNVAQPNTKRNPKAKPGDYNVLRIRDNGCGIERDALPHIFEPFFTTKKDTRAHGLGLAFARGAIQSMGGWIEVRSRPGKGSSFRVFMPHADPVSPKAPRKGGGENVLILHEDDDAREMMRHSLGGAGFKVHDVECPLKATTLLKINGNKSIDVAIVDAFMPDSATDALLAEMKESGGKTKVLLVSGFSKVYVRGQVRMGKWGFLQKPFEPDHLVEAVETLIQGSDS